MHSIDGAPFGEPPLRSLPLVEGSSNKSIGLRVACARWTSE
jgi:hypothetical protein